ncbi:MAG: CAP domain-containing protein [Candidatus Peribacteraceae bacterium]|nr:CAP domain-containing protein [Candidatus Peribacteraceae bacterium]
MTLRLRIASAAFLLLLAGTGTAHAQTNDNALLTRGEAAMLLLQLRVETMPSIVNDGRLRDLKKGHAFERYVLAAERFGILTADAQGAIRPDGTVTRAAFVKMITLTFGLTTRTPYLYKDVPALSWFAPYAGIASRYALFGSNEDGKLYPDRQLTHGEAKRILQSLIDCQAIKTLLTNKPVSGAQSAYGLQIYQKISTQEQELVRVNGERKAPTYLALSERPSIASVKQQVIDLVNAERQKLNIPPLHPDVVLNTSAQAYAEEMLKQNFFGHVNPSGKTLKDRMEKAGYYSTAYQTCFCIQKFLVGENLARGQKTAQEVVGDWMKSPSHKEVLLNPAFTDTGIGVAAGVWVQHFGGVKHKNEE